MSKRSTIKSSDLRETETKVKVTVAKVSLETISWSLATFVYNKMAAIFDAKRYTGTEYSANVEEEETLATHDHFKEIQEVRELIGSLKNVWNDLRSGEMSCERFTCEFAC